MQPHLTVTENLTLVFSIRGRCGKLDIKGCFSTTRALQGNTTKHVSDETVWISVCLCAVYNTKESHDTMSHFVRSFVNRDNVSVSVSLTGPGRLEVWVLLNLLSCSWRFCSRSRSSKSTSATVVNLHRRVFHKSQVSQRPFLKYTNPFFFPQHEMFNVKVAVRRSHHSWRWCRLVSTGAPMQAICCRCFHLGSSTSVRVTKISLVSFKVFSICCSDICMTRKTHGKITKLFHLKPA